MTKVFISYRRADSDVIAGRIRDRLARSYGDDSVFMDIDNIPFGVDFRQHVQDVLKSGQVLVAVIGKDWLARDDAGRSRLEDPTDQVRIEIEGALQRHIPIVPLLVHGATMPKPADLPPSMQDFAFYNAADVDPGRDFHPHMDRMIRSIDRLLNIEPTGRTLRRRIVIASASIAGLLATAFGLHWAELLPRPQGTAAPPAEQKSTGPAASWRGLVSVSVGELKPTTEGLRKEGYYPLTISGHLAGGAATYVLLWAKGQRPANSMGWGFDGDALQKRYDDLRKASYRPTFVSAFETLAGIRYADVWEQTPGAPWEMKWNLTAQELRSTIEEMSRQELQPVHVYGYTAAGISRFAAIFEKRSGDAPVLSLDIPVRENQKEWDTHGSAGYRPRAISGYQLAGADHITTLWDKGTGWSARYALPAAQYDASVEEYTKRDMRLAFLTGFSGQGGTRFNLLWAR